MYRSTPCGQYAIGWPPRVKTMPKLYMRSAFECCRSTLVSCHVYRPIRMTNAKLTASPNTFTAVYALLRERNVK